MTPDDTLGSLDPYRLPRHVLPHRYELRLEPDLTSATFSGVVTIALTVTQSTSTVILNAVDLTISSATLKEKAGDRLDAMIELDQAMQRCRLMFPRLISAGEAQLTLVFQGKLNDQLRGFYRSTYKDQAGVSRTMAATQFEATDARRAFP